ncbi:hypothetical protein MPTK1_7g06000 [Marchantia polymorpha subsp. ruderalis]|uniref:Uncharacterized protein n=2 Tax=Marchantia polymorpha TaxID=3197 RepID=A0AAF6BWM2_MARPO|nr:hypothetical protein MARPO_0057s0071 [Marchantia polymorpha]BBN16406.1 hypothetical protein Mp_7g06000 [Marchantia polymorpha subsp. ruderalis]|eukprot:PTQ37436.1 hypothetical protein MARPO_0057s0071 [Marchantia polymorpha]
MMMDGSKCTLEDTYAWNDRKSFQIRRVEHGGGGGDGGEILGPPLPRPWWKFLLPGKKSCNFAKSRCSKDHETFSASGLRSTFPFLRTVTCDLCVFPRACEEDLSHRDPCSLVNEM